MTQHKSLWTVATGARTVLELAAERPEAYELSSASPYESVQAAISAATDHLRLAAEILQGIERRPRFAVGAIVDLIDEDQRTIEQGLLVVDVDADRVCVRRQDGSEEWIQEFMLRSSA